MGVQAGGGHVPRIAGLRSPVYKVVLEDSRKVCLAENFRTLLLKDVNRSTINNGNIFDDMITLIVG
jgi:hypothetical protein